MPDSDAAVFFDEVASGALTCASLLATGPMRPRDLRMAAPDAGKILLQNVYDWFVRTARGVYALTDEGQKALARWPQTVEANP